MRYLPYYYCWSQTELLNRCQKANCCMIYAGKTLDFWQGYCSKCVTHYYIFEGKESYIESDSKCWLNSLKMLLLKCKWFNFSFWTDTIIPHYLWMPYLRICLLTKICHPKVNTQSFYDHLQTGASAEQWTFRVTQRSCSQLRQNKVTLCLLALVLTLKTRVLFTVCLVPCFSHFCAFCWWSQCLEWSPSTGLKLSSVPTHKKAVCYRENTCVREASFRQELQCYWLWVQC